MKRYYFTFGTHPEFPYGSGWVTVYADSFDEAIDKFRTHFPDRSPNTVNCAFMYTQAQFEKLTIPPGEVCHEEIR